MEPIDIIIIVIIGVVVLSIVGIGIWKKATGKGGGCGCGCQGCPSAGACKGACTVKKPEIKDENCACRTQENDGEGKENDAETV